jgi:hypothetical protein
MEAHPPVAMEGELFDLPPADLLAPEDDLFDLEGAGSSHEPTEPMPAFRASDAAGMYEPAGRPVQAGGLRGWLARLFSR